MPSEKTSCLRDVHDHNVPQIIGEIAASAANLTNCEPETKYRR
jgi:hypothetical protein